MYCFTSSPFKSFSFNYSPVLVTRPLGGFSSYLHSRFNMVDSSAQTQFERKDVKMFIKDFIDTSPLVNFNDQISGASGAGAFVNSSPSLLLISKSFKFVKNKISGHLESTHTFLMNDDPSGTFINFVLNDDSSLSRRVVTILVRRLLVFTIDGVKKIIVDSGNMNLIKADIEKFGFEDHKSAITINKTKTQFEFSNIKMDRALDPDKNFLYGKQHLSSIEYLVSKDLLEESGVKIEPNLTHKAVFDMEEALTKFNERWSNTDEQLKIFVFKGKGGSVKSELIAIDNEKNARFIPTSGSDTKSFLEEVLTLEENI